MPKNDFEITNFATFEEAVFDLVGLMMTDLARKMLIFNKCRHGVIPNLIKKSLTVSTLCDPPPKLLSTNSLKFKVVIKKI